MDNDHKQVDNDPSTGGPSTFGRDIRFAMLTLLFFMFARELFLTDWFGAVLAFIAVGLLLVIQGDELP